MKLTLPLVFAAVFAALAPAQTPAPPKTHLKIGDAAPEFSLPSTTGQPFTLSEFKGKRAVVVAFFPAAFTGGCTKELTAYQAGIARFEQAGAQVVAISTDNLPTLGHWAKELNAGYPLASDFMRRVTAAYGVLNEERGVANRTTFVVDADGKIQHIEEGSSAVDPTAAETSCARVKKP